MGDSAILLAEIKALRADFNTKIDTSQREIKDSIKALTQELSGKIDSMESEMNGFRSRLERFEKTVEELQVKKEKSFVDGMRAPGAPTSKRLRAQYVDNSGNSEEEHNVKCMLKLSGHKKNLSRDARVSAAEAAIANVESTLKHKEIRTYGRYGTESVIVFDNPVSADAFFKDATKKGRDHPVFD